MKTMNQTIAMSVVAAVCSVLAAGQSLQAQCSSCGGGIGDVSTIEGGISSDCGGSTDTSKWPCSGGRCFTQGNTSVACPPGLRSYSSLPYRASLAARDRFSPHPVYAYSRHGIDAARIHEWNKFQSMNRPWHGGYNYWQYNRPTALVVPPTAAFQSSYAWGVGQTRSLPINHQFGVSGNGGGAGSTAFASPPYWPASTEQFGVYPVRAPWSHQ